MLVKWLRDGGFVVARRSNNGWWPHFFWTSDLVTFEEYVPKYPNKHLICPPPLYRGIVKVSTGNDQRASKRKK